MAALSLFSSIASATGLECRSGEGLNPRVIRFVQTAGALYDVLDSNSTRPLAEGLTCLESRLDPRLRRCSKANAAAPVGVELVLRSSIQKREDGDVVHTMFAWIEVTGTGPGFAAGPIRFREAECEGR